MLLFLFLTRKKITCRHFQDLIKYTGGINKKHLHSIFTGQSIWSQKQNGDEAKQQRNVKERKQNANKAPRHFQSSLTRTNRLFTTSYSSLKMTGFTRVLPCNRDEIKQNKTKRNDN